MRRWVRRMVLGALLGGMLTAADAADQPDAEKLAASLKQAVNEFHQAMLSDKPSEHAAGFRKLLPTEADVKALFPTKGERVWKLLGPIVAKNIASASDFARSFKERSQTQPVKDVRAISIRTDVAGRSFDAVIAMMKTDVPLYRIELVTLTRTSGSSSYLFINDRWVWIRGLEMIPEVLAAEDEEAAE